MITTWQKYLVIFIGIVFGIIVGYICIKPHIENTNIPNTQNLNTNDVFEQYLNNDSNNANSDSNEVKPNINIED